MQYSLDDLRGINSFEVKYRDKETDTDYLFWGKILNIRNIINEDTIDITIWDWEGNEAHVDESSHPLDWINEWVDSHKAIPVYEDGKWVSKSMKKASPYTLDWCGDKLSDALECLHDCFMSNYTDSHHSFFNSILQQEYGLNTHTLIQAIRTLRDETRARRTPDYMASTRKSIKSDVEQFSAVVKSIRDRR